MLYAVMGATSSGFVEKGEANRCMGKIPASCNASQCAQTMSSWLVKQVAVARLPGSAGLAVVVILP